MVVIWNDMPYCNPSFLLAKPFICPVYSHATTCEQWCFDQWFAFRICRGETVPRVSVVDKNPSMKVREGWKQYSKEPRSLSRPNWRYRPFAKTTEPTVRLRVLIWLAWAPAACIPKCSGRIFQRPYSRDSRLKKMQYKPYFVTLLWQNNIILLL